jgi:hypothetical protein
MRWLRLLLITLVLAWAAWAAVAERHAVRSFAGPEVRALPGMALAEGAGAPWWPGSWCEAAATDALVRRGDDLFHLATLAPEQATLKDCKT